MRHNYIRVNSLADIDTSRITVRGIENRYVDAQGRRYATRFNLRTRHIEVVPIALGRDEALALKRLAGSTTTNEIADAHGGAAQQRVHPQPMKLPNWLVAMHITPDMSETDLQTFLATAERELQRNGERYRGLIQSLKMSAVLEDMKDGNQHDAILEITNTYERDIQGHTSRVQAMVVEFMRFPKPLASYLGQIDRNCKRYVEKLDMEKQKKYCFAYLLAAEMFGMFKGGLELIEMIERFTAGAKPEQLNYDRKSAYESAMQSLQYIKDSLAIDIAKFTGLLAAADVI